MPLSRYEIRCEHRLADPELYGSSIKDDPESLLEGVSMAGLVGLLRQMGDLAEFAAEIFNGLHEEVMTTSLRGHGLMVRVQQLEADFPSVEKLVLSQTDHSKFFRNKGADWNPRLYMEQEQNLITQGDVPRFVLDSYEECRLSPRLYLLDKFDVTGPGSCLKRYTDPSFYKVETISSGTEKLQVEKHNRNKRVKQKRGSHWRKRESILISHPKLQELFLKEHLQNVNNDLAHVKLKRREVNGSPFDIKTAKGYMAKFVETSSPGKKSICEIPRSVSPCDAMHNNTCDSVLETIDIITVSPTKEHLCAIKIPSMPLDAQKTVPKLSMDLGIEFSNRQIIKMPYSETGSETEKIPFNFDKMTDKNEFRALRDSKNGSIDDLHSNSTSSKLGNSIRTIDSELVTDSEYRHNDVEFFSEIDFDVNDEAHEFFSHHEIDFDVNDAAHELESKFSQFSDFGATENSLKYRNSFSKDGRDSLSYSDTFSSSADNTLPDCDGACLNEVSPPNCSELCTRFSNTDETGRSGNFQSSSPIFSSPSDIRAVPLPQVSAHIHSVDALVSNVCNDHLDVLLHQQNVSDLSSKWKRSDSIEMPLTDHAPDGTVNRTDKLSSTTKEKGQDLLMEGLQSCSEVELKLLHSFPPTTRYLADVEHEYMASEEDHLENLICDVDNEGDTAPESKLESENLNLVINNKINVISVSGLGSENLTTVIDCLQILHVPVSEPEDLSPLNIDSSEADAQHYGSKTRFEEGYSNSGNDKESEGKSAQLSFHYTCDPIVEGYAPMANTVIETSQAEAAGCMCDSSSESEDKEIEGPIPDTGHPSLTEEMLDSCLQFDDIPTSFSAQVDQDFETYFTASESQLLESNCGFQPPEILLEQNQELQVDQSKADLLHGSGMNFKLLNDQSQGTNPLNHMDHYSPVDVSSESSRKEVPIQPSANQKLENSEQSTNSVELTSTKFVVIPEASRVNLEEIPMLPPLPTRRCRTGKLPQLPRLPNKHSTYQLDFLTYSLEDENRMKTYQNSEGGVVNLDEASEDENPSKKTLSKRPRSRDPLIQAVASHDKRTLKKVEERVHPEIVDSVTVNDALLEQIRAKSFNLKPAILARPIIQGSRTNLRFSAILEKANAIRQAFAGSDEDDNWSDS